MLGSTGLHFCELRKDTLAVGDQITKFFIPAESGPLYLASADSAPFCSTAVMQQVNVSYQ